MLFATKGELEANEALKIEESIPDIVELFASLAQAPIHRGPTEWSNLDIMECLVQNFELFNLKQFHVLASCSDKNNSYTSLDIYYVHSAIVHELCATSCGLCTIFSVSFVC